MPGVLAKASLSLEIIVISLTALARIVLAVELLTVGLASGLARRTVATVLAFQLFRGGPAAITVLRPAIIDLLMDIAIVSRIQVSFSALAGEGPITVITPDGRTAADIGFKVGAKTTITGTLGFATELCSDCGTIADIAPAFTCIPGEIQVTAF